MIEFSIFWAWVASSWLRVSSWEGVRCIGLICLAFALFVALESAKAAEPPDPVLGHWIAEGAVFKNRLWLRGTQVSRDERFGGLVSFDLTGNARRVHFETGVIDLHKSGGQLWVLHRHAGNPSEFVLLEWRGATFEEVGRLKVDPPDQPLAIGDDRGSPLVLTQRGVYRLEGKGRWRARALSPVLGSERVSGTATPLDGHSLYVGFNAGEFGGGLQRVDLATGAVQPICCPLAPVTGIIPDPVERQCVLVSAGYEHMALLSEGRILQVCGDQASVRFEKPAADLPYSKGRGTEAFYGLSAARGGYWAITWRALYRFSDDAPREYPLPKLERAAGVWLSRELPGVVVVGTAVNGSVSVSGYFSLVVGLEE